MGQDYNWSGLAVTLLIGQLGLCGVINRDQSGL